jgi:hypothetical protein
MSGGDPGVLRFRKMDTTLNEDSISGVDPLAKAERWLAIVADHVEGVWDQEALVYLMSRGRDCHDQVTALVDSWKAAEQARLGEYHQRVGNERVAGGTATNIAGTSISLRAFWGGAPPEDHSFEATMLRTVDWCEIAGFEQWWQRLARERKEKLLQGGIEEPTGAAYWLFHMVRSDYAIALMPRVLNGYLESISLAVPNERQPWVFENGQDQHMAYGSAIVFAHHRLNSADSDPELIDQAVEMICRQQDPNGAWRTLSSDAEVSIESTAMALHALALARPPGWQRMAIRSCDWLWSAQCDDGSWSESGTSGAVHLTVLVLDAIALANGEKNVTFRSPSTLRETPRPADSDAGYRSDVLPPESGMTRSKNQGADTVSAPNIAPSELVGSGGGLDTAEQRRAAIEAYRKEVFERTGKTITKTDIWKKARYKTRSEFERWQRNDPKATKTAHQRFTLLLTEKPHLK